MDTWQEDQIRRMQVSPCSFPLVIHLQIVIHFQLGGNAPFNEFMKAYPSEGGFTPGMSTHEKYHCWAASQYREKVHCLLLSDRTLKL